MLCVDVDEGLAHDIAEEVDGIPWSGDATNRDEVERMFADATAALGGLDGVVDIVGDCAVCRPRGHHRRRLGLVHVDEPPPRVPCAADRLACDDRRRRVRLRDVGVGAHLGSSPRAVRRRQGRAHVVGAHIGRRARAQGIRVNSVSPGVVWTPRVSGQLGDAGKTSQSQNAATRRRRVPVRHRRRACCSSPPTCHASSPGRRCRSTAACRPSSPSTADSTNADGGVRARVSRTRRAARLPRRPPRRRPSASRSSRGRLDLNKSTTHAMLTTLADAGYVAAIRSRSRTRSGPHSFARSVRRRRRHRRARHHPVRTATRCVPSPTSSACSAWPAGSSARRS